MEQHNSRRHEGAIAISGASRQGVWCREGDGWIVGLGSSRAIVRDSKGMAHLAQLLARPGEEASALDMVAAEEGTPVAAAADAGPLLDDTAKADYRRRLEALATEIAKAERLGDADRSEKLRAEFDFLGRELRGAIGLGGRDRKSGSSLERARVNVTRSIRSAIERIEGHDPALAAHLRSCIRTGAFCVYEPQRDDPVRWSQDAETLPAAASAPATAPGPSLPAASGEVTVMFMDIEDSTALMEKLGERVWLEALAIHNAVVRARLAAHGGREVKAMGDGFMLTFDDPRQAVWCAIDVQRELDAHCEREPDRPLRVRMGIHRGQAVRDAEDVLGRTVVLAARLCQQARGGQILVSDAVREAAGDLDEIGLASVQVLQLRGLRGHHRAHELVWKPGRRQAPAPPAAASWAQGAELLERDFELDALRRAIARARGGEGGLVVVEGPAGIGKSSLLLHVLEEAEAAGLRTLRARATRLEADVPFGAAQRLFESSLRALDEQARDRLLRGPVRPAAAMLGQSEPGPGTFSGESSAMHILNGLFWLAVGLADGQPLVIALDDGHWADRQTLEWIEYASNRLVDVGVVLLVSGRGGADSPLGSVAACADEVITLRPLSEAATAAAVRSVWPEATRGFALACHTTSAGNPFFLREIIAAAHSARIEPTDQGALRLPEATPDSIARTVLARVAREGGDAKAVARALAVLGGNAELSVVAELAGLAPTAALTAADALDRAEIVDGAATLSFAHPLIGAVVERDLRAGERALLHEAAARLLLERGATPERVAIHLLHSRPGADPQAVETLRAAAAAAGRGGAPAAAARLLERAVAEPPAREELPAVLLELGRALQDVGDEAEALAHLERAFALAETERLRGEVLLTLSGMQERQDNALRLAQIDELIARLGDDHQDLRFALEARAIEMLGWMMMASPSPEMTRAHDERLRRGVEEARGESWGERQLLAISTVHRSIRAAIPATEARALALRALDDGALTRRLAAGTWSADSAIEALSMTDAFEEADRHARDAERHARESGAVTAEAYACLLRSMIALHRGALSDVESLLRSVFAITRQLRGPKYVEYAAQQVRACSAIERGDLSAAGRAADALTNAGLRPWGAPIALGRLHAARGEHQLAVPFLAAAHDMHRVAGIWRTTVMGPPGPDLVLSLVAVGSRRDALEVAREEVETARRFGAPSAVGSALRALAHADEPGRAVEHLTEATAVLAPSLALLVRGHVLCDLGSAQHAAGDAAAGRHSLRQALEISVQCGARRLTDRAMGELALAGVRPSVMEARGPQLLSPAERRVAELAAEGAEDLEIAQALFVSPRAVAEQLATAIGKLGLESREELARVMRERLVAA